MFRSSENTTSVSEEDRKGDEQGLGKSAFSIGPRA